MGKLWGCAWGLGLVLVLSEAAVAMPEPTILVQQGETGSTDETRAAAQRAFAEAERLLLEGGTVQSQQQALEKYQEALQLWKEVGDRDRESLTLLALGFTHNSLGERQKALEYWEQALLLSQAVDNRVREAIILGNIGQLYLDVGEPQRTLEYYKQSLSIYQALSIRAQEALTLAQIGRIYFDLEDRQRSLDYYEQALLLYQALGDRAGEAVTLNNIGKVYFDLGERQRALEYYERSLLLSQAVRDRIQEATTLNNIGRVYDALGERQKALEYYEQSLPLRRAVGDREGEGVTLSNIGKIYDALGERQKALEYYQEALPLSRAVGDREGEATTLNNIGKVYLDLGEHQRALEYFEQSLNLLEGVGARFQEASALSNIGAIYSDLGDTQKALEYLEQSLPLRRAMGDRAGEAITLTNIGGVYSDLGDTQKALEYYEQALPLFQAVGDRAGEAIILTNIGGVYSDLGKKQKALEYLEQALPLRRAVGDRAGEANTLFNIAFAERNSGNLQTALTYIQTAIDIIEDLRTNIGSQELRTSYFATIQNQGYYQFYIKLLMELHRQNPDAGYDSQALHISERARARGLLELLTEANADIRQGVDPELLAKERDLQKKLNAADFRRTQIVTNQYGSQEFQEFQEIEAEIQNLLNQLQTLEGQIRANSPRYAELQYPEPLTLSEIQQQILDDDTLLLQYSLGEEASYLWAVSKTGITSYELPPRAQIEAATQPFLEYLKSPTGSNPESGIPLSQILLAPVAEQLNGQRLLIVGDGILQTIPFAALPSPNLPLSPSPRPPVSPSILLENHEIASLPSASSLAISRRELANRPIAPKTLAVLADPVFSCLGDDRIANSPACETADTTDPTFNNNPTQPWNSTSEPSTNETLLAMRSSPIDRACTSYDRLKYTQTEANAILSLVPENQSFQATGFDASRATATSAELANYQIVHLATHGCVGKEHPSLHGIVLSLFDAEGTPQDGFLRLQDIFNLNLPAELVVLSACQTGIGDNVKGEGIVGLTRGFMYAGAKRVAVSLWSVNDLATAALMEKFYQQMLDGGLTATAAMRAAQLEMMQAGKPAYEWAAFVVQGEWRQGLSGQGSVGAKHLSEKP